MKNDFMTALWGASVKMTVRAELPELATSLQEYIARLKAITNILKSGNADEEAKRMYRALSGQISVLETVADTIENL